VHPYLQLEPYGIDAAQKRSFLVEELAALTKHHAEKCSLYANVLGNVFDLDAPYKVDRLEDVPFLPVSLFKSHELRSITQEDTIKVLTSSGTTGAAVSRVFLDRETALLQAGALIRIMQEFLGKKRVPMVVVDHPNVIKDRQSFSARGAGIMGMLQFGRKPFYALRDDMSLDLEGLREYLAPHQDQRVLFFGFTFMVWKHLVQPMLESGDQIALKDAVLVHSGGWKKLESMRVSKEEFNTTVSNCLGSCRVLNFYGMVEQVGSVFLENPKGYLHTPAFSDVLIRDPHTLEVLPDGEVGLIQVLSILPRSYPGHSILTEDRGRVISRDDADLEMRGTYFEILGRVPRAELRGCSDTYAESI